MDARTQGYDCFLERKGIVKFITVKKKYREKAVCVVPIYDPEDRKYKAYPRDIVNSKGFQTIQRLCAKYFPDENEQVFVNHNQSMDKANDADYALIMLLLAQSPTIVKSQREIVPGITIAYLFDAEHEANINVKVTNTKFEAIAKVVNMSFENQRRLMFYLGSNPDKMSDSILKSTLFDLCEKQPERITSYFNDIDAELVTMINILKEERVITRSKGVYYYGKIYLGQSIREIVSWSKEDKNAEAFTQLRKSLKSNLVSE